VYHHHPQRILPGLGLQLSSIVCYFSTLTLAVTSEPTDGPTESLCRRRRQPCCSDSDFYMKSSQKVNPRREIQAPSRWEAAVFSVATVLEHFQSIATILDRGVGIDTEGCALIPFSAPHPKSGHSLSISATTRLRENDGLRQNFPPQPPVRQLPTTTCR
jgi:hypothetical protein